MDPNYFTENMKLKILRPVFTDADTTNDHHRIQCMLCSNVFEATPKSKKQNFGKWKAAGCPICTRGREDQRRQKEAISKFKSMGYELLEEYTSNKIDVLMKNVNCCGRPFTARVNNVLMGGTICPPCNNDLKAKRMKQFNQDRHEESLKYKEGLDKYTKQVRVLSEQAYREHKDVINPNDYPRGRNIDYHLDHIKSISECFHADIPPEECAHYTNLQMLPYAENISKGGSNRNV